MAISLVCEEEEKYLAEIEKLIKKSISKETAKLDEKVANVSHERAKPKHDNKHGNDASNKLDGRQAGTSSRSNYSRKPTKTDPWFDKPYEPTQAVVQNTMSRIARKIPLAALLGGLKRD